MQEAQKYVDPVDPDPEHCYQVKIFYLLEVGYEVEVVG